MHGLRLLTAMLPLALGMTAPARAAEDGQTAAFHAAIAAAYRPYREAYYYFETGNTELAALTLDDFAAAWAALVKRYADHPPPGYAKDDAFKVSLAAIGQAADAARADAEQGADDDTLEHLSGVRTGLARLRQRNGQRTYSDCIDAMNAAMTKLWVFWRLPRGPSGRAPDPTRPETASAFKALAAETETHYRRCRDEAPAAFRDSEEFRRLFDGAFASFAKLAAATQARDADAIASILRELRSFDKLVWVRFG
jgi:hypothetical protein